MFTELQRSIIRGALQTKGVKVCQACNVGPWTIGTDLVMLSLASPPHSIMGEAMPNVPIICNNCGFTQLHNVFALGIADALGVKASQMDAARASRPSTESRSSSAVEEGVTGGR